MGLIESSASPALLAGQGSWPGDERAGGALVSTFVRSALASAAFGAAAAAGHGLRAMARAAYVAPAVFVGGAVLAAPTLYLAVALSGGRLSPARAAGAVACGAGTVAVVLLGLAAPALFFSVTLHTALASELLRACAVVVGVSGVAVVAKGVLRGETSRAAPIAVVLWCVLAAAIGLRLIETFGPLLAR